MRKRRIRPLDILIILIFLVGICIMTYPLASDYINHIQVEKVLKMYRQEVHQMRPEDYTAILEKARDYNRRLKKNPNPFAESMRTEGYEETLKTGTTGIMGYVMIEKIKVRLPFYHGTEEEVLQTAIGHLEGTEVPVGDPGDHAVLSAHRGLPSAKLFSDLPELEIGDTFVVTVLDREMTYEVDQKVTVLPDSAEAAEAIQRQEGMDLVTLMTCTPYGVNTHRLLVRGHRIEGKAKASEEYGHGAGSGEDGSSWDQYIPYVAAAAVVMFLLLWFLPKKKQ